jgi:hypothetical protein
MSNTPRIVLRPNPGVTTEQACNARAHAWAYAFSCFNSRSEQEAAVYSFVLFDSQASKGGPDDLTKNVTKECTTSPEKKGTDNTDIHRNGL